MKKTIALTLVLVLTFMVASTSIAMAVDENYWPVDSTSYGSVSDDVSDLLTVGGFIAAALGYGTAATF